MTRKEIQLQLEEGMFMQKQSYSKWKRNKIVRGSFYAYSIGETKITEAQFEYFSPYLTLVEESWGAKTYKLKEP